MTTEVQQTTQGGVDTTTEDEQRVLDEQRQQEEAAKAAAEAAAKAAADAAEAAKATEEARAAAATIAAAAPPPVITVPPIVPTVDAALAARNFDQELQDLNNKWADGDVDQTEYSRLLLDIGSARARLEAQQEHVRFAQTQLEAWQQQQAALQAQNFAQAADAFVTACPDLQNPDRRNLFQDFIKRVDTETGNQLPDAELLSQARSRMLAAFPWNGVSAAPAPAKPTPEQMRQAAAPPPPPRLGALPTNPGAVADSVDDMNIVDLEDHLARMTPDAREAFLMRIEQRNAA